MIDRLRELHARGDSFTEIADALGVSKGAVAGKVHRLDLPPRPLPAALEGVKNKPRVTSTDARLRATGVGGFQVAPVAHQSLAEASAQPGPRAAAATAHLP